MTALTTVPSLHRGRGARPAAVRHARPARPSAGRTWAVRWDRVALLAVGLSVAVWFLVAAAVGASQADTPPDPPVVVVVQPGDTLWALAVDHAPPGIATLEYVDAVQRLNGVRAGALRPGTALQLPQG